MVEAQRRVELQGTIGDLDPVGDKRPCQREIGHRKGPGREHVRRGRHGAITQSGLPGYRSVDAPGERVLQSAGGKIAAEFRRAAEYPVAEHVEPGAVGSGITVFGGELPVFAVLPIGRDLRKVDRAAAVITPVQGDARPLDCVVGGQGENAGRR